MEGSNVSVKRVINLFGNREFLRKEFKDLWFIWSDVWASHQHLPPDSFHSFNFLSSIDPMADRMQNTGGPK